MRLVKEIVGKEVLDSSVNLIGKVKDVEVDLETQTIESFVIGEGGIRESLGMSSGETVIPYELVKKIGDKILLKSGIEETEPEQEEITI